MEVLITGKGMGYEKKNEITLVHKEPNIKEIQN
jgi:hypothetical protein